MNRSVWIVAAVVVLALGLLNVVLGTYLVPTIAIATEKGTAPGFYLIWCVILLTLICSVSLAGFLLAAGLGKVPETADSTR
jgi:hypothetical protein